jgi:hypothetical protein
LSLRTAGLVSDAGLPWLIKVSRLSTKDICDG